MTHKVLYPMMSDTRNSEFNAKQSKRHISYIIKSTPKKSLLSHASAKIFDESPEQGH